MRGITIKLPEALHEQLSKEARATGRSIASLVREKLEAASGQRSRSVFDQASDLAGVGSGSRKAATNQRRKFRSA